MAIQKILPQVKTDAGYDTLQFQTDASVVTYNDTTVMAQLATNSTDIATAQTTAESGVSAAAAAQTTADAAMPKAGGTFDGNVVANSTNRSGDFIRNVCVKSSANTNVSTNTVYFTRK